MRKAYEPKIIIENNDPIEASLKIRLRLGGYMSTTVRSIKLQDPHDRYWFKLQMENDEEVIAAKKNKKLRLKQWRDKMKDDRAKEKEKLRKR